MYKNVLNQKLVNLSIAKIEFNPQVNRIILSGNWLWSTINEKLLTKQLQQRGDIPQIILDGSKIENVDTIGIYFIIQIVKYLAQQKTIITAIELNPTNRQLYTTILANGQINNNDFLAPKISLNIFTVIGAYATQFYWTTTEFISFLGYFCTSLFKVILHPQDIPVKDVIRTIYDCGVKGLGVAALLSFLIGITLAYQMAPQFTTYGANIYIVNFLGISLLKEVSPLLTAIIVAGRTGAGITAEIGTKKIQEEVDAIQTMGISYMRYLVIPKVIGVIIALPIITIISDIASIIGGAVVANTSLSISYSFFIKRMQSVVDLSNYTGGVAKSFAFGLMIALVGCFYGLKVKGNANSIGTATTNSVVVSIISIVLIDAIFAIIFKVLGI